MKNTVIMSDFIQFVGPLPTGQNHLPEINLESETNYESEEFI